MALAFYVDGPDSLARAFAAHDEYTAVFTYFVRGKNARCRMLTPDGDNYYSAPFCFMPKHPVPPNGGNNNGGGGKGTGYLVFTSQVPWLHGNPKSEQKDRAHYQAEEWMRERGKLEPPHIGTVEDFQGKMGLREMDVHAFTPDGCYPTCEEISQALEDRAVEVTCAVMGWKVPENWRSMRRKMTDLHSIPILNLAEWDQHQRQRRMRDDDDRDCDGGDDDDNDDGGCDDEDDDDGRARGRDNDDDKGENGGGDDDGGGGGGVRRDATTTRDDDAGVVPPDHEGEGTGDGGDHNDDDDDRQEEKKDCSTEERRHQR